MRNHNLKNNIMHLNFDSASQTCPFLIFVLLQHLNNMLKIEC